MEQTQTPKKKVYLSGAITGLPKWVYKRAFDRAEQKMRELGYLVFNPTKYEIENGTWEDYMKRDLKGLMDCTHIYMLKGWKASRGAKLEYELAKQLKIEVLENI